MAEREVALIAVLGGDGTHKAVAAEVGDIPLLTLSTGTNNAFPELREATRCRLGRRVVRQWPNPGFDRLAPQQALVGL